MLNVKEIKGSEENAQLESLLSSYQDVFKDQLGCLKDFKVNIKLKQNDKSHFLKARPVPYAIKSGIERELDRLVNSGVYQPCNYSTWATLIVPEVKEDGTIRICGDYKLTINKEAICDNYPVPKTEDLLLKLNGGEKFTKLDLAHAYQQLDEESKEYLTISTHRGLFKPTRLQFGVHSAAGIFQRCMEQRLCHIPFTIVRVDDILVSGRNDKEHLRNLEEVLKVLSNWGLRLKKQKCPFMTPEVVYLGYMVDKKGISPCNEKILPMLNAPEPKTVTQLKSYLGMLNYYHRHLPDMATVLEPLHILLRKNSKWIWGKEQVKAFKRSMDMLCSAALLRHYDPNKPLVLQCDASPYGVGAVLSHRTGENTEYPIAYSSRVLSSAERNYSHIEKEALAIVSAVKKFHQYLYGRHFLLVTDHKPLLGLFAETKPIPTMAAARIQRWALLLSSYQYSMIFRKGANNGNGDCLSRLPAFDKENVSKVKADIMMMELAHVPVTSQEVKIATKRDPVLSKVVDYVLTGNRYPSMGMNLGKFCPFQRRITELSVEDGCLLLGSRVVIPNSLTEMVLNELHQAHPGMSRMKALARSYVWWPGMDNDIESALKKCNVCQEHQRMPTLAPLHPWENASKPWTRLHIDYAGPFMSKMFLIIVDNYSKLLEVFPVSTASAEATISKLRSVFATHGLPEICASDNASCFKSEEFGDFMTRNRIRHVTSAPYHPSTNGCIERAVQTFKSAMEKMAKPSKDSLEVRLQRFLFTYRITPQTQTNNSPAELLMNRKLNSGLSSIKPCMDRKMCERWEVMIQNRNSQTFRQIHLGDAVWIRNYVNGPKWLIGTVIAKNGPVSFEVDVKGHMLRRHLDQIR